MGKYGTCRNRFLLIFSQLLRILQCILNRRVHDVRGIIGNQGKFTKKQSRKTNVFLSISVLISHLVKEHIYNYTVSGETRMLGLPGFLSRLSEFCGRTNFFYG